MNAKCIKSKLTAAFSLIELMVVIAIVALLTAIAVPSYQGYLQQSKVTEIFSLASDQMNQWEQYYNQGGTFDIPASTTGSCASMGNYISCAEFTDISTTPTLVTGCPVGGSVSANGATLGTSLGVVCIQLNSDTNTGAGSINPLLENLVLYFTPYTPTANTATGDTTDTSIDWNCTFATTGSTTNDATIQSLLSPGNCTPS